MSGPDSKWLPTQKILDEYFLHCTMLASLAAELRELSKKKHDGFLNLTKVKLINRVLKPLHDQYLVAIPAAAFLDLLDESELPTNSDAVLIISQYEAAIKEFKNMYYRSYLDVLRRTQYYWATIEDPDGQMARSQIDL